MTIDTHKLRHFAQWIERRYPEGTAKGVVEAADHIDAQAAEIERLRDALQMPMDNPSTWPLDSGQFETASELIAMELAERDGHEGDDKHALIWEGSPPEPWGEVWQLYIPAAQSLLSAGIAGIQDSERRGLAADAARAALSGEGKC